MKKVFVVDEDSGFQASVKSVCSGETVDLHVYTSSMEVLPLIEKEQPGLVFVNLELPDINDFVMYDLLKKADMKPPIPVIITYAEQSEKELDKYKKLKFKPDGFYKKDLSGDDISALVKKYLGDEFVAGKKAEPQKETAQETTHPEDAPLVEDDIIFTEVMGETDDVMESFIDDEDSKDHPLADIVEDAEEGKPTEAVFSVSEGPSVDVMEKTKHREQAARLMSLEKQNHYLRTENNRMSDELEKLKEKNKSLKSEINELTDTLSKHGAAEEKGKSRLEQTAAELKEKTSEFQLKSAQFQKKSEELQKKVDRLETTLKVEHEGHNKEKEAREAVEKEKNGLILARDEFEQQVERLKKENADLTARVNELSDKLTDKQREMIAKDHEFEKRLQSEADKLLRETEDRLTSGAREKEERLRADIARLENEKTRMENAHKDELEQQESVSTELREEIDTLKNTETSLKASIASMEEEKKALDSDLEGHKEKIRAVEDEKETVAQQLKCSEEDLANAVKEKEKIEADLSGSVEKLTKELESTRKELESVNEKADEYKNRLDGLGKLLQQALMLSGESDEKE